MGNSVKFQATLMPKISQWFQRRRTRDTLQILHFSGDLFNRGCSHLDRRGSRVVKLEVPLNYPHRLSPLIVLEHSARQLTPHLP